MVTLILLALIVRTFFFISDSIVSFVFVISYTPFPVTRCVPGYGERVERKLAVPCEVASEGIQTQSAVSPLTHRCPGLQTVPRPSMRPDPSHHPPLPVTLPVKLIRHEIICRAFLPAVRTTQVAYSSSTGHFAYNHLRVAAVLECLLPAL